MRLLISGSWVRAPRWAIIFIHFMHPLVFSRLLCVLFLSVLLSVFFFLVSAFSLCPSILSTSFYLLINVSSSLLSITVSFSFFSGSVFLSLCFVYLYLCLSVFFISFSTSRWLPLSLPGHLSLSLFLFSFSLYLILTNAFSPPPLSLTSNSLKKKYTYLLKS